VDQRLLFPESKHAWFFLSVLRKRRQRSHFQESKTKRRKNGEKFGAFIKSSGEPHRVGAFQRSVRHFEALIPHREFGFDDGLDGSDLGQLAKPTRCQVVSSLGIECEQKRFQRGLIKGLDEVWQSLRSSQTR